MKVKQEYLAELRNIVLQSIKDVGNESSVLEYVIMKYLPKEGAISLSDLIQDEYYDVFEYLFEVDDVEEELERISKIRDALHDAWHKVEMQDFGILCILTPERPHIEAGDTLEEIFFFVCDDMEILHDELDAKMKRFVKLAEEILGFPVEYDFDGFGTGEDAGSVEQVTGRAKKQ